MRRPEDKQKGLRKGFTLIELLIVVAIIAILAAIAVPNFLEAQVRSKIARTKADMRTISLAMEAYFVDYNAYPRHADFNIPSPPYPPIDQQYWWWSALTTPVAYMTLLPREIFAGAYKRRFDLSTGAWGPFIHYEALHNTWDGVMGSGYGPYVGFVAEMIGRGFWHLLLSTGPDGYGQFGGYFANDTVQNPARTRGDGMAAYYDPTNGTISYGDIVRFGPGGSDYISW